jgi:O-antigen/teichoic acid export membrane protein
VLMILLIALPVLPLFALSSSLLIGIGRQWGVTIIGTVAAAVNIALALALIPPFGAIGAAAANSLAVVVVSIPLVLYTKRIIGGVSLHGQSLLRPAGVAAAAAAAALVAMSRLPLAAGAAVGPVVFALTLVTVSLVVRPLAAEDRTWLVQLVGTSSLGRAALHALRACNAFVGRHTRPWRSHRSR